MTYGPTQYAQKLDGARKWRNQPRWHPCARRGCFTRVEPGPRIACPDHQRQLPTSMQLALQECWELGLDAEFRQWVAVCQREWEVLP